MTSQGFSRKRPAPGADPVSYPSQMPNANAVPAFGDGLGQNLSNDEFFQWGQTGQPAGVYNTNTSSYAMNVNPYPQRSAQPSNQLARRPMAQLTARPRMSEDANTWMDPSGAVQTTDDWEGDVAELEARAQVAKRDAQAKRKQIPPFVQKLNSFLEDGRNTDLIRWSDDGNSFIVLDEDEFAKTLIPELFKHNNYASFVRQLNMYGFHKKVGLSDNSMRASERKNKSPSEYANPYFRRGHPDLLWLIQKPKNMGGQSAKRKGKAENEHNDDEGEDYAEEIPPTTTDHRVRARPGQLSLDQADSALTQEQFKTIQRELAAIRHQQAQINRMMQGLRHEHEQLYGQAATFQDQHTRHENSINAILTFLATVYNRSLQGHDGIQSIANLFSSNPPVESSSQGNIVDVGDYTFNDLNMDGPNAGLAKPFKKQPLLLTNGTQPGRANTVSPRVGNSPYPPRQSDSRSGRQSALSPNVEEIFDPGVISPDATAPSSSSTRNADLPQRDMMSVIQNANARNKSAPSQAGAPTTPAQDFSNVLNSLEASSGTGPLSTSRRADVLKMINESTQQPPGNDNALINSTPPPGPANFHRRLASTQADLDQLAKLQAEQDKSVQNLTNLLQPLSPTGSIPGIGDGQSLPPPPLDIDDFLNHNEYFADFPSDGNGNYDFGDTGLGSGDRDHPNDGLHFGDYKADEDDGDELFGSLNQRHDFGLDGGASDQYANMKFDTTHDDYDRDAGGRVESVASSEVTTPKSADDAQPASGETPGPTTRSRGRKMSQTDNGEGGRKRQRAGL